MENDKQTASGDSAGTDSSAAALQLCYEIEKLPASEQQTKISLLAAELHRRIKSEKDRINRAIMRGIETLPRDADASDFIRIQAAAGIRPLYGSAESCVHEYQWIGGGGDPAAPCEPEEVCGKCGSRKPDDVLNHRGSVVRDEA